MSKKSDAQDAELFGPGGRERGNEPQGKKKSLTSQHDADIIDITDISECDDGIECSPAAQKNHAASAKKSASRSKAGASGVDDILCPAADEDTAETPEILDADFDMPAQDA